MDFSEFSDICEILEATPGRLDRVAIVAEVLPTLSDDELPIFVRFLMGNVFPDWSPEKVGIGPNHVYDAVAYVAGKKKSDVISIINKTGDVGAAVEEILQAKSQMSFFTESLELTGVYQDLLYLSRIGGATSQREKLKVVRRLFANAAPVQGKYLARLLLSELRIGVGEGNLRDAIAGAFGVSAEQVSHAHQAANDLGEVAVLARKGEDALKAVTIELFRPVKMMLAQAGTITAMVEKQGSVAAEYKYDGTRFQFHKMGDRCEIYSRRLENVTDAIPDVAEILKNATNHDVILDGEVIAVEDGRPMPFQYVLRRFRRKHDVASHMDSIQLVPNLFDILYCDGEMLIDLPFEQRRARLDEVVRIHVAPQLVSGDVDEIENFYRKALDNGHEGIMVKSLSASYSPGARVREWVKIKPAVDTIDLVVTSAEWGEGKRAGVYGSFLLACLDEDRLIPISRVATGFSDEDLQEVYAMLKEMVLSSHGKEVDVEPLLVVEVGYAEIQKSVNYEGGFALRFPRFIRIRDDKGTDEIETLSSIKERFAAQG